MATVQEAIKRLRYIFTSEGADKVVTDANQVGAAVIATSSTQERATLSLDRTFASLERRFVTTVRAQQDYARVQGQVNAAVAQNPALQERANTLLAAAGQHYDQVSKGQRAMAVVTGDLNARLAVASGSAGTLGQVLATLGPVGTGVAVAIGAAALAFKAMSDASHDLAQKAQELRVFTDATGLTAQQVQALRTEAGKFGLTSDEIQQSIQQFSARFNDLRLGEGELLSQIRRLNPALAEQMAQATDAATAMTLFGRALQETSNVFERNALLKAGLGRGGLRAGNFFAGIDVNSLAAAYGDKGLTDDYIRRIADLEIQIQKTSAKAKQNISSIFAESDLQVLLRYEKGWLDFSESVKNFSLSGDLRYLLESVLQIQIGGEGTLLGKLGIDFKAGYRAPQTASGASSVDEAGFNQAFGIPLLTPQFQAAALRAQIGALGEAATVSQRLSLALQDLSIKGKEAGLSQTDLARAAGVVREQFASQGLNARIGLLGELTSAEEVELQVQYKINEARRQGAQFTAEEIARIKERAVLALEYSKLTGPLGQIAFERDQIGRGDIDATVAARLRSANLPIDLNSSEAAMLRLNEQLKLGKDLATDFATGFARDLRSGVAPMQALTNALGRLQDRLIDMALNKAIANLFGGLTSIFGGTQPISQVGAGTPGSPLFGPVQPSAYGNVFYGGNVIPFARGGIVTRPTVFPMANGAGLMGEAGPEAVMPLMRGPGGKLGVSAAPVKIEINNYDGGNTEVKQSNRSGPDGETVVLDIVKKGFSRGAFDQPNDALYGLRRRKVR